MKSVLQLAAFLLLVHPAQASVKLSLATAGHAIAGEEAVVQLIALNTSSSHFEFVIPESFPVTLYSRVGEQVSELRTGESGAKTIGPGGYLILSYNFAIPSGLAGNAILETIGPDGSRLSTLVSVSQPPGAVTEVATNSNRKQASILPEDSASTQETPESGVPRGIARTFPSRFGLHEAVYFIYGDEKLGAKFQISFKYRLYGSGESPGGGPAASLQFGYTQRSLWDIDEASSPFYDTSYIPSLFFEYLKTQPRSLPGRFNWLGLQSGLRHESNGQSGLSSRDLDTLYARAIWAIGPLDDWHLRVVPEVFTYIGELSSNPDIPDYRGYGQLTLVFGKDDGPALMYQLRSGKDFENFTSQFDLTLPLRTRLLDVSPYFLIQYYDGYGENLLDYNQRTRSLRFGISLVR